MGYGDVPLTTPEVRLFACFHILVSVSWLAALVSSVFNLWEKRSSQLAPVESVTGWKLEVRELVTACSLSGLRSLTMFGSLVVFQRSTCMSALQSPMKILDTAVLVCIFRPQATEARPVNHAPA